jgi:hypothetical protein
VTEDGVRDKKFLIRLASSVPVSNEAVATVSFRVITAMSPDTTEVNRLGQPTTLDQPIAKPIRPCLDGSIPPAKDVPERTCE